MTELEVLEAQETPMSVEGLTEADIEYIKGIENLKPENWENLDPGERLETLQELENKLAEIQGRPPAPVFARPLPPGNMGYFDPTTNSISIGHEMLYDPSMRLELIDTIAHEGRHAYQHYAVEHPGFHPDEHEVEYWRMNFENYLSSDFFGFEIYRGQPVEVDAFRYGDTVCGIFADGYDTATAA